MNRLDRALGARGLKLQAEVADMAVDGAARDMHVHVISGVSDIVPPHHPVAELQEELGGKSKRVQAQERVRLQMSQVEALFRPQEARILREREDVVLRLTGLSFSSGQAVILAVDDTPEKQGRIAPGTGVPVVPAEKLTEVQPDYLLILAWNFIDEILDRTRAFREAGGRYIVPVPALRYIHLPEAGNRKISARPAGCHKDLPRSRG